MSWRFFFLWWVFTSAKTGDFFPKHRDGEDPQGKVAALTKKGAGLQTPPRDILILAPGFRLPASLWAPPSIPCVHNGLLPPRNAHLAFRRRQLIEQPL